MAGIVLATGIVEVIPSMRGSQQRITNELAKVDTKSAGDRMGKQLGGGFGSALRKAVAPALALLGAREIGRFAKTSVGAFSELEDSTAAAGVVFGDSMGSIIKQSKGAARELGLTSQQVISAANTYGTYGKAAGLAGPELAKFSTDFTGLAADMASFKGTSPEQAIEAIGAALRGETEPIRAYGVMLDDASMRQKALELGIIDTVKNSLTPQQKILAAQALIFEQTADAQGDFARTSTSTANIQKTLSAEVANTGAKLGQVLAPAFTASRVRALSLVGGVNVLLDRVLAFQGALADGATTPELVRALGLNPEQGFGYAVNEGIGSLYAFSAAWKANDGEVTSSGVPGFFEKVGFHARQAYDSLGNIRSIFVDRDFTGPIFGQQEDSPLADNLFKIRDGAAALAGGDFSALSGLFSSIMAVAKPAGPIIVEVGTALGGMSGEIGKLIAAGLPLLVPLLQGAANVMTYLSENTGVLTAVIVGLAGAYVAFKGAQALANIAQLAAIPVAIAQAAANFTLATAIRANTAAGGAQLGQIERTNVGMIRAGVATTAAAVGNTALATSTGAATIGTRLLGAAVRALPFVGLIAILASVVAAGIVFFTQTETGRAIVATAWSGIKSVIGGVVEWFQTTVLPIAKTVFAGIGDAVSWLNTNVVQPVVGHIRTGIGWMTGAFQGALAIAAPVFKGIGTVLNGFWLLARGIFQVVVSIIKNILIPAFVGFWTGTIRPIFDLVGAKISQWWNFSKAIFGLVVGFIRTTLAAGFTWFRDTIITPVFTFVGEKISLFWTGAKLIFGYVVGYIEKTFGPAFTWFRDKVINPVWDSVGGKITDIWEDKIEPIFGFINTAIKTTVPKAFETGINAIKGWWDDLEGIAKAPVKFVVETVLNKGLIRGFNTIAGILPDVDKLPDIALPSGFHRGGVIPGRDPGKRDNVLTPMRSGEGVLVPEALRAMGTDQLHALNHAANIGGTAAARRVLERQNLLSPSGAMPTLNTGFPGIIAATTGNKAYVEDNSPGWYVPAAVAVINQMSALQLEMARTGMPRIQTGLGLGAGTPSNVLAYAFSNRVQYGSGAGLGPQMRRAVSIHELLHVLGQAHTNAPSIMQPVLGPHMMPTSYDVGQMVRLYGAGAGYTGGGGDFGGGEDAGSWDPFAFLGGLVGKLVEQFREAMGNTGIFGDMVMGVGKLIATEVVDWVKSLNPFAATSSGVAGTGASPLEYDSGGWLHNTGGRQLLVEHNKRKPDAVLTNRQWSNVEQLIADRGGDDGDRGGVTAVFQGADMDQAQRITDQLMFEVTRRKNGGKYVGKRRRRP